MCRESGIRGQPDYQFKRKIFNRRKKQAGINAYRKWMTSLDLCQEAEEAYIAGNAKKLAEITKTIGKAKVASRMYSPSVMLWCILVTGFARLMRSLLLL